MRMHTVNTNLSQDFQRQLVVLKVLKKKCLELGMQSIGENVLLTRPDVNATFFPLPDRVTAAKG